LTQKRGANRQEYKPIRLITSTELKNINLSSNYIKTRTEPSYNICIHNIVHDTVISKSLVKSGTWEGQYLPNFKSLLTRYPKTIQLVVGANIGTYSLLAAAMGHTVVAFEPTGENLRLLEESVIRNRFQNRIAIVANAISDRPKYSVFATKFFKLNPGATQMVSHNGTGQKIESVILPDLQSDPSRVCSPDENRH
jgi:FkbM family methyltransferase